MSLELSLSTFDRGRLNLSWSTFTSDHFAPSDEPRRLDLILSPDLTTLSSFMDSFETVWNENRDESALDKLFRASPRACEVNLSNAVDLRAEGITNQEPVQPLYWSAKSAIAARAYQSIYAHRYEIKVAEEFARFPYRGFLIPKETKMVRGLPYQYIVVITKCENQDYIPRAGTRLNITIDGKWGLEPLPKEIQPAEKVNMLFKAITKAYAEGQRNDDIESHVIERLHVLLVAGTDDQSPELPHSSSSNSALYGHVTSALVTCC
ncbi:uncharacterized protein B0I36DRAFT_366544 [Microdochium trichocladiopsis]|uniref:Uncharacterized protein n=1 Tax=Microdochium trichocladiopsis TaxID=1682393 RepID=A0A9P8XYW7_9PEZI|nr:uncharacterized protein B0I36DRAFT_366544 [Microdochium trichocladiopsis]KAH7024615.1 hypothetical protein B0I36DRAFT_366544 [Microdochium trichocladiopsis]